jgi:hypothetical protein
MKLCIKRYKSDIDRGLIRWILAVKYKSVDCAIGFYETYYEAKHDLKYWREDNSRAVYLYELARAGNLDTRVRIRDLDDL